jgi:hypothetical protein
MKKKFRTRIELDDYFESFGKLLACPFLRMGGGWWVSRFEDPCLHCKNESCPSFGEPFKYPKKLMILVIEEREEND